MPNSLEPHVIEEVSPNKELAYLIGLEPVGNHWGKLLGHYLGLISEDEVTQGRPMLSALAVTANGVPGAGFFQLAVEQGRLKSDEPSAQEAFWQAEKKKVYETWQGPWTRQRKHE